MTTTITALYQEWRAVRSGSYDTDKETDAACDRMAEIERQIAALPATSPADLLSKARVAEYSRDAGEPLTPEGEPDAARDTLTSFVADLDRFATPAADAALLALVERWWENDRAANTRPPGMTDDDYENHMAELCTVNVPLAEEIVATEARTVEGILAKLRIAHRIEAPDDAYCPARLEISVVADLERLARSAPSPSAAR